MTTKSIKFLLLTLPLCCVVAAALTSCTDYLDVQPYGRTIPKTAEEFSALVHGQLDKVDEGTSLLIAPAAERSEWDCGAGDNFEVCLTETSGQMLLVSQRSLLNTYSVYQPWSSLYEIIRDCNIVIDNMEEEGTALADHTMATAYAMRAVAYYELIRYYCEAPRQHEMDSQLGLPVVTQFDMEARPIRSSLQQTAELVERDLRKSISYHCSDNLYRFTEDVAWGYLARLYFWTEQWDKALPVCDSLLKRHPLVSADEFLKMANEPFQLNGNKLVTAYRVSSSSSNYAYTAVTKNLQFRPVSTRFLNCFVAGDDTTDVRYQLSVNRRRKVQKPVFCGMRAAEFQLIKAEALCHLGQTEEALAALNELRSRRIKDYKPLTLQTLPAVPASEYIKVDCEGAPLTPLIGAILVERRKELFMEGDRFWELKRNGSPEFWTAYNGRKYTTLSYMYTWPIPEVEVRINPAIEQNPGYTELIDK